MVHNHALPGEHPTCCESTEGKKGWQRRKRGMHSRELTSPRDRLICWLAPLHLLGEIDTASQGTPYDDPKLPNNAVTNNKLRSVSLLLQTA